MNKKGVTLIELLIVIVIIGVISSYAVIFVGKYLATARDKGDLNNLATLNTVTIDYRADKNITNIDTFNGISNDEDRILALYNNSYLSQMITPLNPEGEFIWNIDSQLWEFHNNGSVYTNLDGFDFSSNTLAQAVSGGAFIEGGDANVRYNETTGVVELEARRGKIINAINKDEYTVTINWSTETNNDPRVLLIFDYHDATDLGEGEGYIILLRANTNFARLQSVRNGESYSTISTFYYTNSGIIPKWSDDRTWYGNKHESKLVISRVNETTKNVAVYIDGTFLCDFNYNQTLITEDVYYGVGSQKNIDSDVYVHTMSAN